VLVNHGCPAAAVVQHRDGHYGRVAGDPALQPSEPGGRHQGTHPTRSRLARRTRALLDAGADPNETDGNGFTLLYYCAIGNRTEVARLLIERGARVNAVDPRGMTPLLYATSADFGDSSMVDLLLKMGANPAARTREGLTAQDLAHKYGHTCLAPSFESSSLR
jgi:ankyrin repeat protein